jgi:Uncharacterized conserved protein
MQLNTNYKLPDLVYFYVFSKVFCVILIISLLFGIGSGLSGILSTFLLIIILFGLPITTLLILHFKNISYLIDGDKLTINSGIISKHSLSIPYVNINNIENISGPFMSFFELADVKIWTSSQSQVFISAGTSHNKPDGSLIITKSAAEWLKNYLLSKHTPIAS